MRQQRHHPFFSRFGCGTAILMAVILGLILFFRGGGPFNPGPLSAAEAENGTSSGGFTSHAAFEEQCGQCHAPWRGVTADRCEACHEVIAVERQNGTGLHGLLADTSDCARCHTEHAGRDALLTQISMSEFDHARLAGFNLAQHTRDYDGTPLVCSDCHVSDGFAPENVDCVSCHTAAEPVFMSEHTEQFGTDCLACHDGSGRLLDFSHDEFFVLEGAHAEASCEGCHSDRRFAGTPEECVACHAEPDIHAGLFGLDCARCHTTEAWSPATLQAHTFPLDHGDQGKQACETCHTTTYTDYTCYNCHEHGPAEVRREHLEEGIQDFADCVACHPTGLEDEAERIGRENGDEND